MMEQMNSPISADSRQDIITALFQTLSDTVVATMQAQNFHWNVTGMSFGPLHDLFQKIYEDHFTAQDELAERMRAVGAYVDASLSSMAGQSTIQETRGQLCAEDMIKTLLRSQEILSRSLSHAGDVAAAHSDRLTEDLCIERGLIHEKFAWMLRAHIP